MMPACKLYGLPREGTPRQIRLRSPSKEMAEISWIKDEDVFNSGVEVSNEETNIYASDVTLYGSRQEDSLYG